MRYLLLLSILLFTACGYKPANSFAKQEIGEKVYVSSVINKQDVINSVLIKDILNQLILAKIGSKIVYDKKIANTIMNIKLDSVDISQIQYDRQGFVRVYRTAVTIKVDYQKDDKTNIILVSDFYDFSVHSDAIISNSKKEQAVKTATSKAIEELFSKIAVQSVK